VLRGGTKAKLRVSPGIPCSEGLKLKRIVHLSLAKTGYGCIVNPLYVSVG
jgi:hypothetical protein